MSAINFPFGTWKSSSHFSQHVKRVKSCWGSSCSSRRCDACMCNGAANRSPAYFANTSSSLFCCLFQNAFYLDLIIAFHDQANTLRARKREPWNQMPNIYLYTQQLIFNIFLMFRSLVLAFIHAHRIRTVWRWRGRKWDMAKAAGTFLLRIQDEKSHPKDNLLCTQSKLRASHVHTHTRKAVFPILRAKKASSRKLRRLVMKKNWRKTLSTTKTFTVYSPIYRHSSGSSAIIMELWTGDFR